MHTEMTEALIELSMAADTAELLMRQHWPDEASSLRIKVAKAIEVLKKSRH